ncbi:substrate-binding domain-containing protein [Devosia sp. LjRoot16]|uniref:substrate-binding domain-containing protein n=1 Tax=Devosia sp. LjRoot16 TaxID=3342271 RepID=UPI003ECF2AAD
MKTLIAAMLAATALCAMPALAEDKPPLRIIYATHADSGNTFWLTVKKGMDDACAIVKADCQMLFIAKAGDVAGHIANIQAAIAQQPDLLITSITDDTAFDAVVKEAVDAGIAVISSNVDDNQGAKGNARAAFVGQSFFTAGQALATRVAGDFPAEGPIRVLIGVNAPADNWSRTRANGIIAGLEDWKAANPSRDISWHEIDAGLDYGTSADRFGSYFTSEPNLTAYFDTGFWDVGVVTVLKDRGIDPGKVILGGFDLVPDVLAQMQAGYIQYHVDQQPYLQGWAPVMQAGPIRDYKMAAYDVDTGSAIVTKDMVGAIEELSKAGYR